MIFFILIVALGQNGRVSPSTVTTSKSPVWAADRLKMGSEYYMMVLEKCQDSISENGILTIPLALEAIRKRTISPLISDVKTGKLVGINMGRIEEVLKSLNIVVKLLA